MQKRKINGMRTIKSKTYVEEPLPEQPLYNKTAYVTRIFDGRALAMICDKKGELEPAWIKIQDNAVSEIEVNGEFISVTDIKLDIESAKEGNVWEFSEPIRFFNGSALRFRVLDIGHNYFEAIGAIAYVPGRKKKDSKDYRPPKPYVADIPCFLYDWGKREFIVYHDVLKLSQVLKREKEHVEDTESDNEAELWEEEDYEKEYDDNNN
jgi:hypothetical protein